MTFNVTDYVTADAAENGWDLVGWWCGWIGEKVYVVPLGDTDTHVSPGCRCNPHGEIIGGKAMMVHDAFDGRQNFEATA